MKILWIFSLSILITTAYSQDVKKTNGWGNMAVPATAVALTGAVTVSSITTAQKFQKELNEIWSTVLRDRVRGLHIAEKELTDAGYTLKALKENFIETNLEYDLRKNGGIGFKVDPDKLTELKKSLDAASAKFNAATSTYNSKLSAFKLEKSGLAQAKKLYLEIGQVVETLPSGKVILKKHPRSLLEVIKRNKIIINASRLSGAVFLTATLIMGYTTISSDEFQELITGVEAGQIDCDDLEQAKWLALLDESVDSESK